MLLSKVLGVIVIGNWQLLGMVTTPAVSNTAPTTTLGEVHVLPPLYSVL